jgi:excisionase family DNA binding protein
MNKKTASDFLGMTERNLMRHVAAGRLTVRYIKGKTSKVADFDEAELGAFKTELERPVEGAVSDATALALPATPLGRQHDSAAIVAAIVAQTVDRMQAQRPSPEIGPKLLLNLAECQALTGLSRTTLRDAIEAGDLKAKMIGKAWRVKRAELEAFVNAL